MFVNLTPDQLKEWFLLEENRQIIRKQLPRGYAKEIANNHNVTASTVYKLMAGSYFSIKLLVAVLETVAQHQNQTLLLSQTANNLINQINHEKT